MSKGCLSLLRSGLLTNFALATLTSVLNTVFHEQVYIVNSAYSINNSPIFHHHSPCLIYYLGSAYLLMSCYSFGSPIIFTSNLHSFIYFSHTIYPGFPISPSFLFAMKDDSEYCCPTTDLVLPAGWLSAGKLFGIYVCNSITLKLFRKYKVETQKYSEIVSI